MGELADVVLKMIEITETVNWLEVVATLLALIGALVSAGSLRAARAAYRLLAESGQNGDKRAVSEANIDGEWLNLCAQLVVLALDVNVLTLPSRYGWQSVVVSAGLMLTSLLLAAGSLRARRLRRTLLHPPGHRKAGDELPTRPPPAEP